MSREIWLPIKGYEGKYEVSSFGRVRSLGNGIKNSKQKVLSPYKASNGYLRVDLWRNGIGKRFLVHRLVAEAFLPNWFDDPQVNHIDEDKTNNNIENLEWCDAKYNTNFGTGVERRAKKQSKQILQLTKTGEFVREWPSTNEVERQLGFCHSKISACCRGKRKSHHGFIWRYKESA